MAKISIQKLNKFKKEKGLTNRKISEITKIPIATIDRLFAGTNTNPTVNLLQPLANLFNCTIDDFIEYEEGSPLVNYYVNKETSKLAQEIFDNPDYKALFDASKNLEPEQLKAVINVISTMKGTNNG